jgi:hypothetical protein
MSCGAQPHGVLGEPEPVPDHQTRMIVEEAEQVGLAVTDPRPIQGVHDPQLIGVNRLERAEHRFDAVGEDVLHDVLEIETRHRDEVTQFLPKKPFDKG